MADRKLTDLELERELAGDLPAARMAEATDADRVRLGELRAESEAYLRSVDVDMEVKRIQQRALRAKPEKAPAWWRFLVPAGALAAAAAVFLIFFRRGDAPKHDDDIQYKGDGVALIIHLATSGQSQQLGDGDNVKPGDRIRFEVDAAKPGYVAIFGVDGSGKVTQYYPDGNEAAKYDPEDRLMPGAIELDATPGDERVILIYSRGPFMTDTINPIAAGAPKEGTLDRDIVVLHKK